MLCLWLTKLCPANCESCFFKSNMYHEGIPDEKYQFSKFGLSKLIDFINELNNSYLMLSGGGEPMVRKDAVNEIIRKVKTDRVVIVTSGIWAKTYSSAKNIIDELYESYKSREDDIVVVLRLSVDSFHYKPLGFDVIANIIKVFKEYYSNNSNFELRIHTMQKDETLEIVARKIGDCQIKYSDVECVSDNKEIIKILPKQAILKFNNGYDIKVGISKLFLANLKVDLNVYGDNIQKAIDVFEEDMSMSEYGNPSVLTNCDGSLGLDVWIDYNGNVTTWGNQQWDSLYNVYIDEYKDFISGTFNNIISYSFLDKGYYYRERIVKDVNSKAVLRSKVINLRDYAGACLMEEMNTKLYYAIRVIKDYLEEGILIKENIETLPSTLIQCIELSVEQIKEIYIQSDYDIIKEYLNKKDSISQCEWEMLFILINLGHYQVNEKNVMLALKEYNERFFKDIQSTKDIIDDNDPIKYGMFHNRISFMKKEAENFCLRNRF